MTTTKQGEPQSTPTPAAVETTPIRTKHMSGKDAAALAKAVNFSDAGFDMVAYKQFQLLAQDLKAGGAIPKGYETTQQVVMALIAGKEMGMTPVEAIKSFYFVNGTINLWGAAVGKRLRRQGWNINYKDESEDETTIEIFKTGEDGKEERIEDTFKYQDAIDAGWTNNSFAWKKGAMRKRKLRYAALAQLVHTMLPEVLGAAAGVAEFAIDATPPANETKVEEALVTRRKAIDAPGSKVEVDDDPAN